MYPNLRSNQTRCQLPLCMVRTCATIGIIFLSILHLAAQDRFDGVRALIRQRIMDGSVPFVSAAVAQPAT